ncbi:hypothetical protein K1719_012803 [Acacia pycnantha]|nr:hypothetical protein K1719_012803 [Acacia pycnantha]
MGLSADAAASSVFKLSLPTQSLSFPMHTVEENFILVSFALILVIVENLSEDEIAGMKEMFRVIDTDNSGHITREELKVGLEKADTDNSGTIDYGEFLAAMLHENKLQEKDHLYTSFTYIDKDGSGYITRDELQQAFLQFGQLDIQLDDIIREVDKDNDGCINYNEFAAMMQDSSL